MHCAGVSLMVLVSLTDVLVLRFFLSLYLVRLESEWASTVLCMTVSFWPLVDGAISTRRLAVLATPAPNRLC